VFQKTREQLLARAASSLSESLVSASCPGVNFPERGFPISWTATATAILKKMASFRTQTPQSTAQLMGMVERGLGTDEIEAALKEMAETQAIEASEGVQEETFPKEIRLIAQALAFRSIEEADTAVVTEVLSDAYLAETIGEDSFRKGPSIPKQMIMDLLNDKSYKWILVEAPNGHNIEADGAVLGACCFSTDGVSRKNGEVEGRLGSIRLFGIVSRLRGLLIGQRLLDRVESAMRKAGCCRSMICVPSPREDTVRWVERRGYTIAGSSPYPASALGHELTKDDVDLVRFVKPLAVEEKVQKREESDDTATGTATATATGSGTGTGTLYQPGRSRMALPPHWRNMHSNNSQSDNISTASTSATDGRGRSGDDAVSREQTQTQAQSQGRVRRLEVVDLNVAQLDERNPGAGAGAGAPGPATASGGGGGHDDELGVD
jgi:ribosomal protein S18 acetylase RimI-like enzyme